MSEKKLTVAVLFGGASSEHEVSRMSVTSILKNIDREKYDVMPVGITKQGEWFLYTGNIDNIKGGEWEQDKDNCLKAVLSPDPSHRGLIVFSDTVKIVPIDVVFPVLHGKNGEDGTIQGLFELAKIPYVGCGVLASADCMDKEVTHIVLERAGVKMAKFVAVRSYEMSDFEAVEKKILAELSYPVYVKPANAGSSVGVSPAKDKDALLKALELAFEHDKKVIVEETVVGQEVECAVIGNDFPTASHTGEIVSCDGFYDYDSKYVNNTSKLYTPARITEEQEEKVRKTAVKAYSAIGCTGLSRVDFFVTENDVILNEINTLPGFTSISMYPKLMQNTGMTYSELLDKLIALAFDK